MYAVIGRNRLSVSVAEYYSASWYDHDWPLSGKEQFEFEYGTLELDVHKNGKRYLTGFSIDPRRFIVDYVKTRYKKSFPLPNRIASVSIDASRHAELVSVDFLRARAFVINGMEKDLIFPQFCKQRGRVAIQGFEVLDVGSILKYLAKRFKYHGTSRIRKGDTVFDFKTGRRWKIGRELKGKTP